jgi:hypothetical protein
LLWEKIQGIGNFSRVIRTFYLETGKNVKDAKQKKIYDASYPFYFSKGGGAPTPRCHPIGWQEWEQRKSLFFFCPFF